MGIRVLLFVIIAFLPFASLAKVEGDFKTLHVETGPADRVVSLRAALLTRSGWSEESIVDEVQRANRSFKKCGLQIGEIKLFVDGGKSYFTSESISEFVSDLEVADFHIAGQPLAIFASGVEGSAAFRHHAFAYVGRVSGSVLKEPGVLVGTIFLQQSMLRRNMKHEEERGLPSILAHELAHVLLNSSHVDYPNILGSQENLRDLITPLQCSKMISSSLFLDRPSEY